MTSLTLKWGTVKEWDLTNESKKCLEILQEYIDTGTSMSVMCQKDTPKQKEIICRLIDEIKGEIYLDWDGVYVSKEDAKKYLIEYKYGKD